MFADQFIDTEAQLDAVTDVLLADGYLDNGETPAEAVQNAAADARNGRRSGSTSSTPRATSGSGSTE